MLAAQFSGEGGHHESVLQGDTPNLEWGEESLYSVQGRKILGVESENWILPFIPMIPCFYAVRA